MKKALALLLCLCLVLSPALAADYPDLPQTHWAYNAMDRAHELGVLTGQPDGSMQPAGALTWGQYLTLLARAFYRDTLDAQPPGPHWAAGAYRAGLEVGVLTPGDFLPVTESTLDAPLTRQEAAVLLARLLQSRGGALDFSFLADDGRDPAAAFSDWAGLDPGYQEAVRVVYARNIVSGMPDGTFSGGQPLTRADGAVLLMRLVDRLDADRHGQSVAVLLHAVDQAGDPVAEPRTAELAIGSYYSAAAALDGWQFDGPNGTVSALTRELTFTYRRPEAAELDQAAALDLVARGQMSWEEYYQQDFWLKMPGENRRKCSFLFGDESKRRFTDKAEADAGTTQVTVPVWRLDTATGVKTAGTATVTVHAALAGEVLAIFTEIYDDPEQFPIKNLGGYDWRGDSSKGEHNAGTAIDLNWEENYQIYDGGRVGAGSHWTPGEDPFSIPADGSVVRIFAAHGFSWGGNAWKGSKDYMHFSYLGK